MANGYIPAQVERGGCDPCRPTRVEQKAFLGGVLGIDVNGERQPISEAGIVDLTFIEEETREAAEQAIASAQAAAESEQTASEAAASARSSESAAQTAANAAEAAKDDAEDAASSANTSKNTADSYATAAQSAAAQAQIADGNAERSAESAIAAAAQAASSAGSALSSANDAYTSASAAQAAADAAQTAQAAAEASEATASTAATTATQAKEAAQTAQSSAEAAQSAAAQFATAASGSATAAAGSATQAAASATAAGTSADAAAASAADAQAAAQNVIDKAPIITDTASGAIASFPDGADAPIKQLTVQIEPVQDLHGYGNPWPAGGGKNLFDIDSTPSSTSVTNNGDGSITVTTSSSSTGVVWHNKKLSQLVPTLVAGETYYLNATSTGSAKYIYCSVRWNFGEAKEVTQAMLDAVVYFYASGTSTSATIKDIIFCKNSETDKSFAPYSNVCPITGWTGAEVTRAEINICDEQFESGGISTTTGQNVSVDNNIRSKYYNPCVGGTTYYIKGAGETKYVYWYDSGKNFISYRARTSDFTMDAPDNAYYFRLRFAGYGTTYNNDVSVNYPSTDTAYHQSHVATYPITWQSEAGTVYGGTFTVNQDGSVDVVADRAYFDGGSKTWAKLTDYANGNFWTTASNIKYAQTRSTIMSSLYKPSNNNSVAASADYYVWVRARNSTTNDVYVKDTSKAGMTAAEFKTAMTGVQFVYELVTPVTYHITAQQMTTLLGTNNWWSNTGNIENLEYRCDTRRYIDKKLAALLAALS